MRLHTISWTWIAAISVTILLGYFTLVHYLESKIQEAIMLVHGKIDNVNVNLLTRKISLQNLEVSASDSLPVAGTIKSLTVNVAVLPWLINRKIVIQKVWADSGNVVYKPSSRQHRSVRQLEIGEICLRNITGEVRIDTLMEMSALLTISAKDFCVSTLSDSSTTVGLKSLDAEASNIIVTQPEGKYELTIGRVQYKSEAEYLSIDSLRLIPQYEKFEFAHTAGEQVARVNLVVPAITIDGIGLSDFREEKVTITHLAIASADLHSFKDKRVPFLRTNNVPLPMESFQQLPYAVSIDSLVIKDSQITIEEIAEDGMESGHATFEHITAASSGISNRVDSTQQKPAVLHARGVFMGEAAIEANFSIPQDSSGTYAVHGQMSGLSFVNLNPLVANLVRFRFESGILHMLKFDFQYTDNQSVGVLEISYEDLRVTGLSSKRDKPNEFKTMLANALLKKDNASRSKDDRVGVINIARDKKRYVFNVWWKSILDGLKSVALDRKAEGKS